MNYTTVIDTISLQVDCKNNGLQQEVLYNLINRIEAIESNLYIHKSIKEIGFRRVFEYIIYHKGKQIASLKTGIARKIPYVTIKFAGLKTYDEKRDNASYNCLLNICAYLNSNYYFKITELDICLDVKCQFEKLLVLCIKKAPRREYYGIKDKQAFANTNYIEKVSKKNINLVAIRSYFYDKKAKNNLAFNLTRFEIKLQSRYFSRNSISFRMLRNTIDKYAILYFKDIEDKNHIMYEYNQLQNTRKREISKVPLKKYQIYISPLCQCWSYEENHPKIANYYAKSSIKSRTILWQSSYVACSLLLAGPKKIRFWRRSTSIRITWSKSPI